MTQDNQSVAVGKKGMNRDVHPSNLEETEYSIALNVNYEDESGNGYPMLQNEHSNILCSKFKEGFKVIGFKHDLNEDKTYYFLTNPETNVSEIGYINSIQNIKSVEDLNRQCECDLIKILNTPLEEQEQEESCTYNTIINDSCNGCLNFSIDFPIKIGNIPLKDEKCGKRLYWTDNLNPQRYIDLTDLDRYKTIGEVSCGEPETPTCLDCNKLRIFPTFEKPCLKPEVIQFGGNLKAGTYEFLIAYCDKQGNEISQYYSLTNPVSIFDPNNNILDQTELAYVTNFGIKLSVTDLDTKFAYYKIAVIQRADVNGATTYFEEGVHSTTDNSVLYTSDVDSQRTSLNKLLAVKPVYTHSEGMTTSNGYLFQYGLKAQKEYNLQPVVNLMGAFLNWQTSIADENLYKDGVNTSLYRSYMRDEIYPFSIRFFTEDGFETALFPLIPRPATENELEVVDNTDTQSIGSFAPSCSTNERNKRWQYYNTATVEGVCESDLGTNTIDRVLQEKCIVGDVVSIPPSDLILELDEPYIDLLNYINTNREEICDVNDEKYNAFLCSYLSDTYPNSNCQPDLGESCTDYVLLSEEVNVQEVINETSTLTEKPLSDYIKSLPPQSCRIYEIDTQTGNERRDSDFEKRNMVSLITENPTGVFNRTYQVVYDRVEAGTNDSCDYATDLYVINPSLPATGLPIHLDYYGAIDLVDLQLPQESTCVTSEFTDKLHKGARWYRLDFQGNDSIVLELTKRTDCTLTDDIPIGSVLRLNIYDGCSTNTPTYCQLVDLEDGLFLKINKADYNEDLIYVTIDAPIVQEVETGNQDGDVNFELESRPVKYRTAPICGCFSMFLRDLEYTNVVVTYDEIILSKTQEYETTCTFAVPQFNGCDPIPFQYGKFSYWESLDEYPDNKQLYDSSNLVIDQIDIPDSIKSDFEDYFTDSISEGRYILNTNNTDYTCSPIRHYKFPDNKITPFMGEDLISPFQRSLVYPIGVKIDNEVVNAFLDIAVKSGLITFEERSKIVKYEVFRGDRSLNRSIVAKGLLYDTYKYREDNEDIYYPNYPYNDLGTDILNYNDESRSQLTRHPFLGQGNNRFTFHSPEIHFNTPTLPSEVSVEGFQLGNSRGSFVDVEGHSKWVILGDSAYTTATVLATTEVLLETAIKVGELLVEANTANWVFAGLAGFGTGAVGAGIGTGLAIGIGVTLALDGFMRIGRFRYEWLKVFRDNGQIKQFGSYYTSEGYYNRFLTNQDEGNYLRGLATSKYLKSGRYSITEESTGKKVSFNNIDRESSVYLSFGDDYPLLYPDAYKNFDNTDVNPFSSSRITASSSFSCTKRRSREVTRNIGSPYISLKSYIPNQYGKLGGIKWIPTSYCGNLQEDNNCEVIYGGDTFISRFSLKRKVPLFLVTAIDQAPRTPFSYLQYSNLGSTRFYCDYDTEQETTILGNLFPELGSDFNFDCLTGSSGFYIKPPSKMYLYYYGIPQFLVESEINNNYRYARKELKENFYPNFGDYVEFTQEQNVSIKNDNEYYYNSTYSKNATMVGTRTLPSTYDKDLYDCLFDAPNGVIYSLQDSSEQDTSDPWLIYRPLDFYQFPTSSGKLIDLKGIESAQVLGRFENQVTLFNAIDTIRDRLTPASQELGNGGIFATRPLEFKKTDLGYAGTQHKAMVSCEFGHFWVDSKRGQVFQVDQNGKNLKEITIGLRNWFKEHLPFKFLRGNTEGFTYEDLDNNFKGIGIVMGWDSRYKRVFLTKRDYIVNQPIVTFNNAIYTKEQVDTITEEYQNLGYELQDIVDHKINFIRNNPTVEVVSIPLTPIYFDNTDVFTDVSFTLGYSPLMQSWVSYYSFTPDYYVNYHNYFQTGKNYSVDGSENGLWSHLLTNKSYFVFYGKKTEWMIEVPVREKYNNKILKNVEYWMDSRRYHNEYDFSENRKKGFDKAWLYNHSNNSGQLNLITEEENNLSQKLRYPIYNTNSKDILATQNDKKWTFNDFFNEVRDEENNLPIWNYDRNQILKTINQSSIKYKQPWKDRLRGDWFLLRLSSNSDSRFKQIFKWSNVKESIYN